jgi:hypothetical protein
VSQSGPRDLARFAACCRHGTHQDDHRFSGTGRPTGAASSCTAPAESAATTGMIVVPAREVTRPSKSVVAGVDIRWPVCVVFWVLQERERQAGAGDDELPAKRDSVGHPVFGPMSPR